MEVKNIIHIAIEAWGSVFCILAAICMAVGKEDKHIKHNALLNLLICACFLGIGDALAWYFRGNTTQTGYYVVRISNFVVFILFYLYAILVADYLMYCLNDKKVGIKERPKWNVACHVLCYVAIMMFVVNIVHPWLYNFDETNHYYRLDLFPISQVVGIVGSLIYLFVVFGNVRRLSDEDTLSCISLSVLPVVAIVVTIIYYGYSLVYLAMMAAVMVCFVAYEIERAKINDRNNIQLREREVALMMSQVSPHFIYNSLAAIRGQILDAPEEAYDTISEFASFLRANLNSKRLEGTVTLADEIENTEVYIKLEKLRLGENLTVIIDLEHENLLIPAMCIQTMVENAIKHGIKPKGVGTVWITEKEDEHQYIISIKDDGVGFDVNSVDDSGKVHIGVRSVKERVRQMVNGWVEISSMEGTGTEINIYIPKKK